MEAVIEARDILTRPPPPPDVTLRYGSGHLQVADLWLPGTAPGAATASGTEPAGGRTAAALPGEIGGAPLILFFHGGFWRARWDRTHTAVLAAALAGAGYAVCTPEYRRIGEPGGGWPGTFDDVVVAVDRLPGLAGAADPGRVVLAGHSAGGHLALWAATRHRLPGALGWRQPFIKYAGVVALAPVSDLAACHAARLDDDAAGDLIGGPPGRYPERWAQADPARLLPIGVPVRLIHGVRDERVPCGMSREFAVRARAAGDDVALGELAGCGHFELIDPASAAWPGVLAAFRAVAPVPGR
jgi:acetyl esterase/lipase